MFVKDIPDNLDQSLAQKVTAIGACTRFVVIEDSTPGGQISEIHLAKVNDWITLILREQNAHSTFMTRGVSAVSKVVREDVYTREGLLDVVKSGAKWAEDTLVDIRQNYIAAYPWRTK